MARMTKLKRMTRNMTYVDNKRTQDRTCVLFCVPPSFVLRDNKYIHSCAIISLNESNEELRMKRFVDLHS